MQNYAIYILRCAQKELSHLHSDVYEDICNSIRKLAQNSRPSGCLKLSGRDGWRIRVGNYRVIYEIDDKQKIVTKELYFDFIKR